MIESAFHFQELNAGLLVSIQGIKVCFKFDVVDLNTYVTVSSSHLHFLLYNLGCSLGKVVHSRARLLNHVWFCCA